MKKDEKKTPMLDPKVKNEQNIKEPNDSKNPKSKPDNSEQPVKEDPEKVPESNDPAGYGESGRVKKGPFKKKD